MYRPNSLKARLEAGESVYGAWVGSGSPGNAELLGHIGFDFLVLDQEHGAGELSRCRGHAARGGIVGHALHGARALERSDLAQAHPRCRRGVADDPIGRDRGGGTGRGRCLPLPAAGPARLRGRRGARLDLRPGARIPRQGQRQPVDRAADRIGRGGRERGRDLRRRGRRRGVHRRQRSRAARSGGWSSSTIPTSAAWCGAPRR